MGNYKLPGAGLGDATPDKVLEGSTFTSNTGVKQVGTMQVPDVSEEVTAQKTLVKEILVSLRIPETPPTGTNKQILQTNNVNLKKVKDKFYRLPVSLQITPPAKLKYKPNDPLDLAGMVVNCTFDNGVVEDVTKLCTVSPMKFETEGVHTVTVSYDEQIVVTGTFDVEVFILKIVTWAGGTDEEIVAMVKAADEGKINLADYWTVGDTRKVHINYSNSKIYENELVLVHAGGYELETPTLSGRKECSFVVATKNLVSQETYGSAWNKCAGDFKTQLPETLSSIFKKSIVHINSSSGWEFYVYEFWIPTTTEIAGNGSSYSIKEENEKLPQLEWYKTKSNRIKLEHLYSTPEYWWLRTRYDIDLRCCITKTGSTYYVQPAHTSCYLSPHGCI